MGWQAEYLRKYYPRHGGWVDGTTEFHQLCRAHIPEGGRILEIGAGPTNPTSTFLAGLGELHGVDIDPEHQENTALASCHTIVNDSYPFSDASFDACVSNYVAEHVERPRDHLREIARVLRPGGVYILRTPNAFHYVALVSRFTPFWFHRLVANRLRNRGRLEHDPYPTFYAMNTPKKLSDLASEAALELVDARLVEKEPSYGLSSRALFLGFVAYERFVNASEHTGFLRSNIFAVLRKPAV